MFQIISTYILTLLLASTNSTGIKLQFKVDEPSLKVELSKELMEISGIAWYEGSIACVQDELGVAFLLNPSSGEVLSKIKFALPGDFEAIEVVGNQFYALTSSGTIFSFTNNSLTDPVIIKTPLSWKNDAEGIAFDETNNRLLILCKENGSLDGKKTSYKSVFAYDLSSQKLEKEPVIKLSIDELREFKDFNKYKPSDLAFDPLTCDLYILSSVGKAVVVLNPEYEIKSVKKLSGKIFHQPEGICFDPQGNLYISNEGSDDKKSNILMFERK